MSKYIKTFTPYLPDQTNPSVTPTIGRRDRRLDVWFENISEKEYNGSWSEFARNYFIQFGRYFPFIPFSRSIHISELVVASIRNSSEKDDENQGLIIAMPAALRHSKPQRIPGPLDMDALRDTEIGRLIILTRTFNKRHKHNRIEPFDFAVRRALKILEVQGYMTIKAAIGGDVAAWEGYPMKHANKRIQSPEKESEVIASLCQIEAIYDELTALPVRQEIKDFVDRSLLAAWAQMEQEDSYALDFLDASEEIQGFLILHYNRTKHIRQAQSKSGKQRWKGKPKLEETHALFEALLLKFEPSHLKIGIEGAKGRYPAEIPVKDREAFIGNFTHEKMEEYFGASSSTENRPKPNYGGHGNRLQIARKLSEYLSLRIG